MNLFKEIFIKSQFFSAERVKHGMIIIFIFYEYFCKYVNSYNMNERYLLI